MIFCKSINYFKLAEGIPGFFMKMMES